MAGIKLVDETGGATVGVLGEVLGGEHTFQDGDKTYHVSLVTQDIKLKLERTHFAKAREFARSMKDLMTTEEYEDHLSRLSDQYMAGDFSFFSKKSLQNMNSLPGFLPLAALLFGCPEDEMIRLLTTRREDVTSLIRLVLAESFPGVLSDSEEAGEAA